MRAQILITLASAILFIILVIYSDRWWLGPGFYGSLIAGIANWGILKQHIVKK